MKASKNKNFISILKEFLQNIDKVFQVIIEPAR